MEKWKSLDELTIMTKKKDLFSRLGNVIESTISFNGCHKNLCIGLVDIVASSYIAARLENGRSCKYYSIFLNSMATIVEEFGAKVVKNLGDSILYNFPETEDHTNKEGFTNTLSCGMVMLGARHIINNKMHHAGLPPLNYRVSSDYGNVMIGESTSSKNEDIFGPTVNVCTKINALAPQNGMVIGGDLHQIVKSFDEYRFDFLAEHSSGFKFQYPVYSVNHKDRNGLG